MRFYLIAMIFIVFDIEIIFLYPWAVIYRNLGAFGLAEILLFTVAVLVSFVYLLSNGALDWGPAKQGAGACRRWSPPSAPPAPRSSGSASTGRDAAPSEDEAA